MYIYNGRCKENNIYIILFGRLFSVYRFAEVVNKFLNNHRDEEGKIDINVIHDTSLLHV